MAGSVPASSPVWYRVCARSIALCRELWTMTLPLKSMTAARCTGPCDRQSRARARSIAFRLLRRIRVTASTAYALTVEV